MYVIARCLLIHLRWEQRRIELGSRGRNKHKFPASRIPILQYSQGVYCSGLCLWEILLFDLELGARNPPVAKLPSLIDECQPRFPFPSLRQSIRERRPQRARAIGFKRAAYRDELCFTAQHYEGIFTPCSGLNQCFGIIRWGLMSVLMLVLACVRTLVCGINVQVQMALPSFLHIVNIRYCIRQ